MRVEELKHKKIVIWGTGKEGLATANLIRASLPGQLFVFIDEGAGPAYISVAQESFEVLRKPNSIAQALSLADIIIKSPGVSLYHPLLEKEKARGVCITSLLNLWLAEKRRACIIGVTGTKGKSTTATLLDHALTKIGKKSVVLGNIGIPVTERVAAGDFIVIEISSYQAANFSETCDIAVLTSLFPEHLDWHKSLSNYYWDKANLLAHSRLIISEAAAFATLEEHDLHFENFLRFNLPESFHFIDKAVYNGPHLIGPLENDYLLRDHNRRNVCAVLEVIHSLGLDVNAALQSMKQYQGLPHRQSELGEKNGILFVDDSISTTPQSAIAAMEVYGSRPLTLIAGGFDRKIDYLPLIDYIIGNKVNAVVCMGDSGKRIFDALKERDMNNVNFSSSMNEAVKEAIKLTPAPGVVLLSPAAPSFGMFKDYIERAESFSKECGFG
jgi:UDP-N-acetylmuramoyl-L-alanine---L-glutamate ligase